MDLSALKSAFADNGCLRIYAKVLAANDNSKNQVYLGGSFDLLNIFPISAVESAPAGNWARERFKAALEFSWIAEDGNLFPAPYSQLILYPKYPEVRFSGFLQGCENPPSEQMTQRLPGRILFLSVAATGRVLGFVASPHTTIARQFNNLQLTPEGVFNVIDLPQAANNKDKLIRELRRIHILGWIKSKRLNSRSELLPCNAPNCGGYTLEAELGITPNGYSEPDFLGWEVKQFGVSNFTSLNNSVITLMTPEPTGGYYTTHGVSAFIHKYGYDDRVGRPNRRNFGGVHKVGEIHKLTNLQLVLDGFDSKSEKIRNSNGMIALVDNSEEIAASGSFSELLKHWTRKHNQACYVPSMSKAELGRYYKYGDRVILGNGTSFDLFLQQMATGNVYYDPGIKMENVSSRMPAIKRRSQFRIKSGNLANLYRENEIVSIVKMHN